MRAEALDHLVARYTRGVITAEEYFAAVDQLAAEAIADELAARAEALPDYRLRVVPPLCGECDERWIETPDGLAKCPRCYPKEMAS